jgi:cell division protein FtsW
MAEAAGRVRYKWKMGFEAKMITVITLTLLCFGLITVYGASSIVELDVGQSPAHLLARQALGAVFGAIAFAIAAKTDAEKWYKLAWPVMIACLVMLLVIILPFTLRIAPRIHGARRYVMGGSLQPSEIAKFAVIIWTAMLIVKKGDAMRRLRKGLVPFLVVLLALDGLVFVEPDLSQAMMYTVMMGIILYAGGVRVGHFVAIGIVMIPVLYLKAQKLNYVLARMTAFFNPGAAPDSINYQLKQSLIAVGSGGVFGAGIGKGRQQYGFLPFGYDDFIGGHIGEEYGFVGMTILVIAFAAYAALGFSIAKKARTEFQRLVAVGIVLTMTVTAYLHIGVVTGLLPTTGLTLPFISYGRSNLVLSLLMTGILVNIGSTREKVADSSATDPVAMRALPVG